MSELCECIFCHQMPRVRHYDYDMWYVWCGCDKRNKYECLGQTKQIAVNRWNYFNRPLTRIKSTKKKK